MPEVRASYRGMSLSKATICLQGGRPDIAAVWMMHDFGTLGITDNPDTSSLKLEPDGSISYLNAPGDATSAPFRRVSTATAIYHPQLRKIIFGFNPNQGRGWELPGGKQDGNETIVQAAAREVFEECGLRVDPIFVGYMDDGPTYCCMFFVAVSDELPRVMEPENHTQWTWWSWQDPPTPLNPFTSQLLHRFTWLAVAEKLGVLR